MVQNIAVLIIVGLAIFFTTRRLYRMFTSKRVECGCETEENCAACGTLEDIGEKVE